MEEGPGLLEVNGTGFQLAFSTASGNIRYLEYQGVPCIVDELEPQSIPEALMTNSVNVPASWERWIDSVEQDDTVWLPMQASEDAWVAETAKGVLTYTRALGMKREWARG